MSRLADHHIEELQQAAQEGYATHNEDGSIVEEGEGTWRVGLVGATYADLVMAFGPATMPCNGTSAARLGTLLHWWPRPSCGQSDAHL